MKKILITGVNGQVGFELQRALSPLGQIIAVDVDDLDLMDLKAIDIFLDQHQPDIIVNPAAFTAVDLAEKELEKATLLNVEVPKHFALWASKHGALLVHYSTDYIFDGKKEGVYTEDDPASPQSVYGLTKWQGEEMVRKYCAKHLIFRTSWVLGSHGHNFLKTILRLAKERPSLNIVADQIGAPTGAALLADVTAHALKQILSFPDKNVFGTYHLTNKGAASWYDYACYVLKLAEKEGFDLKCRSANVSPIKTIEYPLPAKRPLNSKLSCQKLESTFGLNLPTWEHHVTLVFNQLKDTF